MEMRIVICRLIWWFDIALKEGQGVPSYDHRALSSGPLEVRLTPVKR
jgi:hypothetical protein